MPCILSRGKLQLTKNPIKLQGKSANGRMRLPQIYFPAINFTQLTLLLKLIFTK